MLVNEPFVHKAESLAIHAMEAPVAPGRGNNAEVFPRGTPLAAGCRSQDRSPAAFLSLTQTGMTQFCFPPLGMAPEGVRLPPKLDCLSPSGYATGMNEWKQFPERIKIETMA